MNAGFRKLRTAYEWVEGDDSGVEDDDLAAARARLDEAQDALLAAPLALVCSASDGGVSCVLQGKVDMPWETGFRAETLLEDLMRTASREPGRLEPIRRLIEQLTSGEGKDVVPVDFLEIWNAVDDAMKRGER